MSETDKKAERPETDEKREHARITFLKAAACLSDEDIDYLLRIFSSPCGSCSAIRCHATLQARVPPSAALP